MDVSVYRTLENVPRVRFNRDLGLLGYFNQDVGGSFVINICSKKVIFNLVLIGRANFIVVFDNFLVQVNLCQMLFFCRTWGEHVVYKNCSECQKQFLYMFSPGLSLEFSCIELVIQ